MVIFTCRFMAASVAVLRFVPFPADIAGRDCSSPPSRATAGHDGDLPLFQPFFMLSGFSFPVRNMPKWCSG
jgi:hypothetical protein